MCSRSRSSVEPPLLLPPETGTVGRRNDEGGTGRWTTKSLSVSSSGSERGSGTGTEALACCTCSSSRTSRSSSLRRWFSISKRDLPSNSVSRSAVRSMALWYRASMSASDELIMLHVSTAYEHTAQHSQGHHYLAPYREAAFCTHRASREASTARCVDRLVPHCARQ